MAGNSFNHVMDATAGGAILAGTVGQLTPVLALTGLALGCIWYAIEISQSDRFTQFVQWMEKPHDPNAPSVMARGFQWVMNNKPYLVAALAAITAGLQGAGVPVPTWLYVTYAALGGAALHSSLKSDK